MIGMIDGRINHLYLDTNIFIALAEGDDELSGALWDLIGSRKPNERFLCTSELTLAELVVLPYRQKDDRLLQLYDDWLVSGGIFEVVPIDRSVLWDAAVIRAQYPRIKLPDAIHLSSAMQSGCGHILSADHGIPDTLEIRGGRHGSEGPATLTTLRPTPATLDAILEARAAS